eukprot:15436738-Alexandrium_andersonii.AAC.1
MPVGTDTFASPRALPPTPTADAARSATTGFRPILWSLASSWRKDRRPRTPFCAAVSASDTPASTCR